MTCTLAIAACEVSIVWLMADHVLSIKLLTTGNIGRMRHHAKMTTSVFHFCSYSLRRS